jgi:hypothetical protein
MQATIIAAIFGRILRTFGRAVATPYVKPLKSGMVTQQPFNADGALKTARAFHAAASQLEAAGMQLHARIRRGEGLGPETPPPGTVGHPLQPEMLIQVMGAASGAVVLQTLALELVLKVRLARSGIEPWRTHNHTELFAKLPPVEKTAAETRYQARRHPSMKQSLGDVLAASAELFEKWRYMHEHPTVTSHDTEMQRAFEALADGL